VVWGSSALNITGDADLNIKGTLAVTANTIDASAFTGKLSVISGNATDATNPGVVDIVDLTVTGGSGNDTLNVAAADAGVELLVDGGAGDDIVVIGAGVAKSTTTKVADIITGGAGSDTLSTTYAIANAATAANSVGITGFEVLSINDALAGSITLKNTQVGLSANLALGGTGTIVGAAGSQAVSLGAALTGSLTLTDTGVATTDTVSLSNVKPLVGLNWGNGNNIVGSGYETVNISSNGAGTATSLTLGTVTVGVDNIVGGAAANGVSALNFTGTNVVTVGAITASAIDASGLSTPASVGVTTFSMGAAAVGVKTIVGSAGNDTLIGDASSTITGGDGADSITGGSGADTLTGGAGKDTIVTNGGTDTVSGGADNDTITLAGNLSALDAIDGGEGTDTLSVTSASLAALKALSLTEANTFNTNLVSVETITVSDALNTTTFDLGYLTGVTTVNLGNGVNGAEAITGLVAGSTVTSAVALSAILTMGVTGSKAGTTDTLTLKLTESASTDYISIAVLDVETLTIDVTESTASAANTRANTLGIDSTATAATAAAGGSGASQTVKIIGTESLTVDTAIAADVIDAGGMGARLATTAGFTMNTAFTATTAIPGQTITGSGGVDTLRTSTGSDTVVAGAGNDTIFGSVKVDSIDGGAGVDTYEVVGAAQFNVANQEGAGTGTNTGMVINLSTAAITGATVVAGIAQQLGGGLTSIPAGSMGYVYANSISTQSANLDTLTSIENVTVASGGANYIVGSDGANTIIGGAGVDDILSGKGNDILDPAAGVDDVKAGAGNDIINQNGTAQMVTGSAAIDLIDGGTGTDEIRLTAATTLAGSDVLTRITNVEKITVDPIAAVYSITTTAASNAGTAFTEYDLSRDTNTNGNNIISITGITGVNVVKGGAGQETITYGTAAIAGTVTPGGGKDILDLNTSTAIAVKIGALDSLSNGITQAATDTLANFTSTTDTISFGGPAGVAANYGEATTANGGTANLAASIAKIKAAADIILNSVKLYALVKVGIESTYTADNGKEYLIYDADANGTYDYASDPVVLIAASTTFIAADIVV